MRDPFLEKLMFFQTPERQDYVSLPGGGEPVQQPVAPRVQKAKPQVVMPPQIIEAPAPEAFVQGSNHEDYDEMMNEILAEKRGSIEGIQKQLDQAQNGGHWSDKINLNPLAAYLDNRTGGNMSQAFRGPTPEQERLAMVAKLGQAVEEQKNDYYNQALGFFKNKAYMDQVDAQRINAAEDRKFDRWYKKEKLGVDRAKANKSAQGGKELSQNMISKLNEGNQIPAMLDDVRTAIQTQQDIMGPIEGFKNSLNPWHTPSSTLDAQVRAASQAFGRYMEGGVLRKEDEAKYKKMFPNSNDTPEVAANKLLIVERLLKQKQASEIQAFRAQGYNLEGIDKGFAIPEMPGVLGGMQRPMNPDDLENLSDEELEAFVNGN